MSTNLGTITWASVIPNLNGPTWTNVGGVLQSRSSSIYSGPAFGSDVRWPDGQGLHWNITGIVGHYYMFVDSSQYSVSLEVSSIDDGALNIHWSTWDGTTSHSGNVPGVSPDNLRFRREGLVLIGEYSTDNGSTWLNVFTTASFASDAFLTYGGDGSADPWTTRFGDITYAIDVHNISGISIIPAGTPKATLDNLGVLPSGNAKLDNLGIQPDPPTAPDPPMNLSVIPGSTQVSISWIPPVYHGSGIVGYEVSNGTTTLTTPSNNIVFPNLTNSTSYTFTVVAIGIGSLRSSDVSIDGTPVSNVLPLPPGTIPGGFVTPPPPVYNISIGDWKKGDTYELTQISNRSMHFSLTDPSTFSFDISGLPNHDGRLDAKLLHEGISDILVRRNGVPLLLTRLMTTGDNVGFTEYTVSCSSSDYRELLNRRMVFGDTTGLLAGSGIRTFANSKGEDIVWQLIADTQALANLGITKGLWPSSNEIYQTRQIQQGTPVFEAISELTKAQTTNLVTNVLPIKVIINTTTGFDFDIDVNKKANIYIPGKGQDLGVVLDYGGNVSSFTRSRDMSAYANYVRETGVSPLYFDVFASDLASRPEGRWDALVTSDLVDKDSVAKAAAVSYLEKEIIQPTYNVTLAPGKWLGPAHVWLGDMVVFHADIGRLEIDEPLRVTEILINLDQSDRETVTVTCGRSIPRYIKNLKDTVNRLNRRPFILP